MHAADLLQIPRKLHSHFDAKNIKFIYQLLGVTKKRKTSLKINA